LQAIQSSIAGRDQDTHPRGVCDEIRLTSWTTSASIASRDGKKTDTTKEKPRVSGSVWIVPGIYRFAQMPYSRSSCAVRVQAGVTTAAWESSRQLKGFKNRGLQTYRAVATTHEQEILTCCMRKRLVTLSKPTFRLQQWTRPPP